MLIVRIFFSSFLLLLKLNCENRLVRFENHPRTHLVVLVQIEPSTVCTLFLLVTILQHPRINVWRITNVSLGFREKLIVYAYIALWCSSYQNNICTRLKKINFARGGTPEDFYFQFTRLAVCFVVCVIVLRKVDQILFMIVKGLLNVLIVG